MKNSQHIRQAQCKQGFAVWIVLIIVMVIGAGISIYIYSSDKTEQKKVEASPKAKLEEAKAVLNFEVSKLEAMRSSFNASGKLSPSSVTVGLTLSNTYTKSKEIIEKTDILFADPETSSPKIKISIKDPKIETKINVTRAEITKILSDLQKNVATVKNSGQSVSPTVITNIKNEVSQIQDYINQLEDIVSNPNNISTLTQTEIDSYTAAVEQASSTIETIVASVESTTNQTTSSNTTPTDTSTQTSSTVTEEQIADQEEIVEQAQINVAILEDEVANADTNTDTSTTGDTSTSTNSTNTNQEPDIPVDNGPAIDPISPNQPKLIQGANKN